MMIFGGPHFDLENSPFDSTGTKLTRLFKGGSPRQAAAPAQAAETPTLVGQAKDDDFRKDQKRRAANQTVLASGAEATFGQKLKLGS